MAAGQQDWTSPDLFCLVSVHDREKIPRCACTTSSGERYNHTYKHAASGRIISQAKQRLAQTVLNPEHKVFLIIQKRNQQSPTNAPLLDDTRIIVNPHKTQKKE